MSDLLLTIMGIANFEVLPTGDIFGSIFSFTDTEAYTSKFEQGGFETSNFVFNLGTLFIAFIIFAFLVVLMSLIKVMSITRIKCFDTIYDKMKMTIFWNGVIRFTLEGYLELVISSYVNL